MTGDNDKVARHLLIEQTRKETLDEIKQSVVGMIVNGEFIVKKNVPLDGYVVILSDEKYKTLFKE